MQTLFDRLAFASGLLLATAGALDIVLMLGGPPYHNSVLLLVFALFLAVFFSLIAPGAILYVIIKLAVRDAKSEKACKS